MLVNRDKHLFLYFKIDPGLFTIIPRATHLIYVKEKKNPNTFQFGDRDSIVYLKNFHRYNIHHTDTNWFFF